MEQQELNLQVNKLLAEGIIRNNNSYFGSPIVLARQKSGDYRALNAIIVRDRYPYRILKMVFTILTSLNIQ